MSYVSWILCLRFYLCVHSCFHRWLERCVSGGQKQGGGSTLQKAMMSVSLLTLVGLKQEMIVLQGLQLNVATIILGCIFSILISDFRACGPISISTPSIEALTEFFDVDTETNVHLLLVSWYCISLLWKYLCSCMHIMPMLWSIAETISSSSWPILFKILTLNVTICIALLNLGIFCFSLSSNQGRSRSFFNLRKGWWSLDIRFEYESS